MAQKAKKERAKNNSRTLNQLHIGTLLFNSAFLLFHIFIRRQSILAYVIISIPCFIAEFILETTGRPKYDAATRVLKSSGEDLSAPGLTEYMFDIIWITWFSLVSFIIFGSWGLLLWSIIPVYGAYKGYELLVKARNMMKLPPSDQQATAPGNRKQRRGI